MENDFQTYSFGEWLKHRRKELRLTQRALAAAAFCSVAMIKKIEADERQPSPDLAQSLAEALQIPVGQQALFVQIARGERPLDRLYNKLPADSESQSSNSSLPSPGTPFVGRTAELANIQGRMREENCRLLTLIGPGGMGKTRLAIEAALSLQGDYADGAVFVPLAAVSDPEQVPGAVAKAMQVPLTGSDPPVEQVARLLSRREMLLVLDNFEQLAAGAVVLSHLLAAAPNLKMLVTSRERLNLAEEWLFAVAELDEALTLFSQTAERVQPGFVLEDDQTAVQHICDLVANHPLAIELAASWTRFMSCKEIGSQIKVDLDFLGSGPRNAPERHHSIRALFDYSWQSLTIEEQHALAKLSVFRGGFAADEAQQVAGAGWPILIGLVDKSLVEMGGRSRFDLHELIRQYASAKLDEMGQEKEAKQAHFLAFRGVAAQFMNLHTGSKSAEIVHRLEREHDNIRTALDWGLDNDQTALVLPFLEDLFLFWLRGGYWRDGEAWLKRAVNQASEQDSAELAIALNELGVFIALQGRLPEAKPLADRAMAMARRVEDPWALVITLQTQGQANPDHDVAIAAFEEAVAICRDHEGEWRFDPLSASILHLYGGRLRDSGRLEEAKIKIEESLARYRKISDNNEVAYPLGNLGRLALQEGDLEKAHDLISESVALARRVGRVVIADWVFRLGQVHLYMGELDEAQDNLEETLGLYEDIGNHFGPPAVLSNLALIAADRGDYPQARQLLNDSLGRYRKLEEAASYADQSANFMVFGDSIDILLHAGLVAYAVNNWTKALLYFSFVDLRRADYEPIQPLQERVLAAKQDIDPRLSADEIQAVIDQADHLSRIGILSITL